MLFMSEYVLKKTFECFRYKVPVLRSRTEVLQLATVVPFY